jgi:MFS family permease
MADASGVAAPWTLYRPAQRWGFLAILFLVSLCNYVDRQVLSVLIEPIKHEFHVSDAMMGLLGGFAFAALYAVLGLPIARWSDRGDRRVIITLSIAAWSVMSLLCGFARSFWLLAAARMGVGIGEAGAVPPAQSLMADYFPPRQRGKVFAVFTASATFGYLIAFSGGAWIAATHGWRMAFIALSAPGLLLAVITFAGLREPRRRAAIAAAPPAEPLRASLIALARKPSFVILTLFMVLYYFVAYGAVIWFPAFLVRVMHQDLSKVGALYGLVSTVSALAGTLGGGWIVDALTRRDPRWLAWFPALCLLCAFPLYEAGLWFRQIEVFYAVGFIAGTALGCGLPATFALLHRVCGSARRALAVAVIFFFANLLGLGFGPLITGALSDWFTARVGPSGLTYALMIAMSLLVPCGVTLFFAGRTLEADAEA